jgi:hypothetical protein
LNPVGVQSIFETLSDLEYKFVTSIRLIKTRCQDEGLQHVIKYLKQPDNVITFVDLLDNEITSLGITLINKRMLKFGISIKNALLHIEIEIGSQSNRNRRIKAFIIRTLY